jgi:thiol-disulfide isomerase/thioredoxin
MTSFSRAVFLGAAILALQPALSWSAGAAVLSHASGIAWQKASTDAEVDKAFALGRQTGKPVFLYWGAVWCPPCNQVKATLFSRPDFVERSRAFVPVYVDGDKPGAQKVAARFKVAGYPTMVLFKPDGTEITRLPGEVDPERYLLTLTAGLNAQTPVKELLRRGLAKQAVTPEQWRLLAFYSWDTDEQQVLGSEELPRHLAELAAAVPSDLPQVRDRIAFKSLVASATADGPADRTAIESGRRLLDRVLGNPETSRQLADILTARAESVVKFLAAEGEPRRALASRWQAAVGRLLESGELSKSDRVDALDARVALWKLMDDSETLSAQRRTQVLREIAGIVAATTDRYERQAVVPGAAHVLTQAGLIKESDELLKFELPRAVAPYYHMLVLASNAVKRSDAKAALGWYEQAWRKSEGPATRIQWGTGYVRHVLELAPNDVGRVEGAAAAVVGQLDPKSETFYERNQRSLQKMAADLAKWKGSDAARIRTVEKIKQKLAKTCTRVPAGDAGRANCESVFSRTSA